MLQCLHSSQKQKDVVDKHRHETSTFPYVDIPQQMAHEYVEEKRTWRIPLRNARTRPYSRQGPFVFGFEGYVPQELPKHDAIAGGNAVFEHFMKRRTRCELVSLA